MIKNLVLFSILILVACQPKTVEPIPPQTELSKTYIDPAQGYSQAVVVEANGIKTIYISGQVGTGDNFEAQFRDAIGKLLTTLGHSGATFDDVVKYTTFVVDYRPEYLDTFRAVRKELLGDTDMPASTLVGVPTLGLPEWGVEIEAIAVVSDK